MAKARKSSKATDKDKTQEKSAEDAVSTSSEAIADAVVTDDGSEVVNPADPLDRAIKEMEETSAGAVNSAEPEALETPVNPEPADPLERAESEMIEVSEGIASTAADPVEEMTSQGVDAAKDEFADDSKADSPLPEATAAALVPQPQHTTKIVRGSIWPGFFGGVIAALVGFIVGRGDALDDYLPASMQRPSVDTTQIDAIGAEAAELATQTSELAALIEAQSAQIDAQITRIDTLEAAEAPSAPEIPADLENELADIANRLAELESRPVVPPQDDAEDAATAEALAELQNALDVQNAEIAALAARAEEAESRAAEEAARILARAALMRVQVAVESGATFSPELTELEEVAPVEVPDALRAAAEAGVPTLAALQDSFPDAARAGLAAARAEVPESEVDGLTGFLRRQLNARSVAPREGSDPDAVLSRAQAAVRAGDLGAALTEMEALPEAARTAMQDWLDAASARKAAQDAADELADSLNSN